MSTMNNKLPNIRIPIIVAIVMLILATLCGRSLPYGFYQLLRIVVFASSSYIAYLCYRENKQGWMWGLIFAVMIFNPVLPIKLDIYYWQLIDFVTAIYLTCALFIIGKESGGFEKSDFVKRMQSFGKISISKAAWKEVTIFIIFIVVGIALFIGGKIINPYEPPFERTFTDSEIFAGDIPTIMKNGQRVADTKNMPPNEIQIVLQNELGIDSRTMTEEQISTVLIKPLEKFENRMRLDNLKELLGKCIQTIGLIISLFGYLSYSLIRHRKHTF